MTTPTGLAATGTSGGIKLTWTANPASDNVTGYKLFRASVATGPFGQIQAVGATTTSFLDNSMPAGATRFYSLRASNAGGDSGPTANVSATRLAVAQPSVPKGLVAVGASDGIELSWDPNPETDEATEYEVFRATTSTGPFQLATKVLSDVHKFVDDSMPAGQTRFYSLRAVNVVGESAPTGNISALRPAAEPVAAAGPGFASTTAPAVTSTRRVGPNETFKNFAAAFAGLQNNTEILFQAGQTFDLTAGVTISQSNIKIGSFGAGAKPKLNMTTGSGSPAIITHSGNRCWIENLRFDASSHSATFKPQAIVARGTDLSVQGCEFGFNIDYGANIGAAARGCRVFQCTAPDGVHANFWYAGEGSQFLELLQCTNTKGSQNEHCFRNHGSHVRILGNTFGMNLRTDGVLKGFQIRLGQDIVCSGNDLSGTGSQVSMGPLADEGNKDKTLGPGVTFTGNNCHGLHQFQLFEGITGLMIHGNKIEKAGNAGTVIQISSSDFRTDPPQGVIENNTTTGTTFINGDTSKLTFKGKGNTLNGNPVT